MAQLKDIKERINSVKKTRKMTQAMKMVSAAKFKRYSKLAITSRFILNDLDSLICETADATENNSINILNTFNTTTEILVILAGDRGLCGGYNSSILKSAHEYLKNSDKNVELILFGRKAVQEFKNSSYKIIKSYENFNDSVNIDDAEKLFNEFKQLYLSQSYSKITLLFNEFKTAVTSNLIFKQIFPVKISDVESDTTTKNVDVIIEPEYSLVFESLISRFIK